METSTPPRQDVEHWGALPHLSSLRLVIHERLGYWARHLRSRLAGWPLAWVETRSTADLEAALRSTASPIVIIDVADRPLAAMEDLDRAMRIAPDALILVLDPRTHDGISTVALELGATHVMAGGVVPPAVSSFLTRWIWLAQTRNEAGGWSLPEDPEPEPWSGLFTPRGVSSP
jgi:hypothetical protein